jgi:hypothetical protein
MEKSIYMNEVLADIQMAKYICAQYGSIRAGVTRINILRKNNGVLARTYVNSRACYWAL